MILCCGEALIDMIPSRTLNGNEGFVPHSGGAVFNTAIALGRLGLKTGMLTGLSTDMFGRQLIESLKASRVDTSHVIQSDRPTTLAFVRLVDGHATYCFFDENSAGRMMYAEDLPLLSADVSSLFFGGISLACEPVAEAYSALLERNAEERVVMIDPNVRPRFIEDVDRYRIRLERLLSKADIIKLSDEDLNWLLPTPLSLRAKIATLLEKGASVLILTRGGKGAVGFFADGKEVHVEAERTEIADTVGAGDTFNAGVLAKLSELGCLTKSKLSNLSSDNLREAIKYGVKVASVTVSRVGANPPWAGEV